ncbi:MAG: Trm112 family protein [Planctomycetes bacterium]|nr:Trm112 family protein [Planctomycetota bacterium]
MIDDKFLAMLVCPIDHRPLHVAAASLLALLNERVAAGSLRSQSGSAVKGVLNGALINEPGTIAYLVIDDIPNMVAEDSIPLDQVGGAD